MAKTKFRIITSLTTVALVLSIGISSLSKKPEAAAAPPPTNSETKALFSEKCSACHDLPDPEEKGFTKEQWVATVNRMLNTHNARTSISDDQAAEIVSYLGQFAPKPGADNAAVNGIGVWQYDPVESVAYPFTYGPNIANFDIHGGNWKVLQTADITSGYMKCASTGQSPALLVENKHNFVGALDIQTQLRVNQSGSASVIGLAFGVTDSQNYMAAEYNPSTGSVSLVKVTGGQSAVIIQANAAASTTVPPDSWHNLRVKVTENGTALEVLVDFQRQIKTTDSGWQNGKAGLITVGPVVAGFRQLTIDSYQSSVRQPSGDVLLH